jgi:hypothetical protein
LVPKRSQPAVRRAARRMVALGAGARMNPEIY